MTNLAHEERFETDFAEDEITNEATCEESTHLPDVKVDSHFDFKLEGWPAAATLMTLTLCLAGVTAYGINTWSKVKAA